MPALMRRPPAPVDRRTQLEAARLARANASRRRTQSIAVSLGIVVTVVVGCVVVLAQLDGGHEGEVRLETIPVSMLFAYLRVRRRRLRSQGAEDVLADDRRPPVVWLRPFELDGDKLRMYLRWSWRSGGAYLSPERGLNYGMRSPTYEEHLIRGLADVAPVVALGDPLETLPRLGAARLYADDASWQPTVAGLLEHDGTIILHIGDSPRLLWEARQVVALDQPERLILSLPRHGERGGGLNRLRIGGGQGSPPASARGGSSRHHRYEHLRQQLAGVFPAGLPAEIGDSQFVYFGAGWVPSLFPVADAGSPMERVGSSSEQRDRILEQLGKDFRIRHRPAWVLWLASLVAALGVTLALLIVAGVLA